MSPDFFQIAAVLFVCVAPFALLAGVVFLVFSSRISKLKARIDQLENETKWHRYWATGFDEKLKALGMRAPATADAADDADAEPTAETPVAASPATEADADAVAAAVPGAASATAEPAPSPSPEPTPIPAPAPSPARARAPIAWERWIGVRGAAALGSLLLVFAGFYFFAYSIEHGLITEPMRVVLGTLVGLGCLVASETILRKRYVHLANWIGGAGSAVLYVTFWAASARYELIPNAVAGVLMALVTATCCLLSIRHASLAVAMLGFFGGFATPLLLSTGSDRPITLFGYLLVLDVALLYVARKRSWPLLAFFSLLGTTVYQALWIGGRMGPDRLLIGTGVLVVFGVVFALASYLGRPKQAAADGKAPRGAMWMLTRIAAALLPFLFALHFGTRGDLGPRFYPIALFLGVVVLGTLFVSRTQGAGWLGLAAAFGALGVLTAWLLTHSVQGNVAWEVVAFIVGITAILQGFVELNRRHEDASTSHVSSIAFGSLASIVAMFAACDAPTVLAWPWIVGWAAVGAIQVVHARLPRWGWVHWIAAGTLGFCVSAFDVAHAGSPHFPRHALVLPVLVAIATLYLAYAMVLHVRDARSSHAYDAAALLASLLLVHHAAIGNVLSISTALYGVGTMLLAILVCVAGAHTAVGAWLFVAVIAGGLVHSLHEQVLVLPARADSIMVLVFHAIAVLFFVIWPLVLPKDARNDRWTWRAAALSGPVYFLSTLETFEALFGDAFIAVVPLSFAVVSLCAAFGAQARAPEDPAIRKTALAWLGAAALGFVAVAIPLQLENEWVTIAWAAQAVLTLALWRHLDHAGLKYFALALLAVVTVRLVVNPYALEYHTRSSMRILNWLAYTYLVPVACLVGGYFLLREREVSRYRPFESKLLGARHAWGAYASFVAAVVVFFVWINLAILDWFTVGEYLQVPYDRKPARDLTMSIAWALYALALLGLGMWRSSKGLRFFSLGLVLITCGKVFLLDLSHLRDLYRVASLVGLALSLILISFAYQRFVFRKTASEAP